MPGTQCPPTKTGSSHSMHRTRGLDSTGAMAAATRSTRSRSPATTDSACACRPVSCPTRWIVSRISSRVVGSRETMAESLRAMRTALLDLLVGDRADVAELLGEDQVRRQPLQELPVQVVDAAPPVDGGADVPVYLRAGAARVVDRAAGDAGLADDGGRVIALVGDGYQLVLQAQDAGDLRGAGEQRANLHGELQYRRRWQFGGHATYPVSELMPPRKCTLGEFGLRARAGSASNMDCFDPKIT